MIIDYDKNYDENLGTLHKIIENLLSKANTNLKNNNFNTSLPQFLIALASPILDVFSGKFLYKFPSPYSIRISYPVVTNINPVSFLTKELSLNKIYTSPILSGILLSDVINFIHTGNIGIGLGYFKDLIPESSSLTIGIEIPGFIIGEVESSVDWDSKTVVESDWDSETVVGGETSLNELYRSIGKCGQDSIKF